MDHIVNAEWTGGMNFEANFGDKNKPLHMSGEEIGYGPKKLMLSAVIGCTGLDVASLLKKMRAEPDSFKMEVKANLTDEHPKIYDKVHLTYKFSGSDLKKDKIEKAVGLSIDTYCGVSAMFEKFADFTHEIQYL